MKGNELISAIKKILVHYDLSYKYKPKFIKKSDDYPDAVLGIYLGTNKDPIMVVYKRKDKFCYEYEVLTQGRMYYNDMSGVPDSYDMVEFKDNKKVVLFDSIPSAVDSYCSMIINEEANESMLNDIEEFFNEEEY